MSATEIVLSIISVISFILAVYSFIRTEISKTHEQANVEITKEKLGALNKSLESLFQAANAIIQNPKKRAVSVEELQDLARVLRAQIILLSNNTNKARLRLDKWKFGVILNSEVLEDETVNIVVNDAAED